MKYKSLIGISLYYNLVDTATLILNSTVTNEYIQASTKFKMIVLLGTGSMITLEPTIALRNIKFLVRIHTKWENEG